MNTNKLNMFFRTFGCQMNKHDSDRMAWLLKDQFQPIEDVEKANLIIINSCCVRQKAEEKVYSYIGRIKPLKEKNPELIIALAGCVAQKEAQAIFKKFPYVDLIFGTDKIYELPKMIDDCINHKDRISSVNTLKSDFHFVNRVDKEENYKVAEYVTIMNGCNNYCSYCIVPYVRGPEVSRNPSEIMDEIKKLADRGTKEVTLLGQNVNSYSYSSNGESLDFCELLLKINEISGISRIRFVTSHPKDISNNLIQLFGKLDKLCEQIHLPVQSGSNRILELMNRKYDRDRYLEIVDKLREICPRISISTDLIVGYPGETEADFNDTLTLVKKVEYDAFFSFVYSPRSGTSSFSLNDDVPLSIKKDRLAILQYCGDTITDRKNKEFENKIDYVLFEGKSKRDKSKLTGRLRSNRIINMEANSDLIGKEVKIKITKANKHFLSGILEERNL